MHHTRAELVEKYIRTAWILKIRLMSCRRTLWADEFSQIHSESACLQMRKIVEGIAHLCLIASDIEYSDIPNAKKYEYRVGTIFSYLTKSERLIFPGKSSLEKIEAIDGSSRWSMIIGCYEASDIDRIKRIFDQAGNLLHEFSPYNDFPGTADLSFAIYRNLTALRSDHKWLWNRFWQHGTRLKDAIFFVDLGETQSTSRPQLISQEEFLAENVKFEFEPTAFSDFSGEINWNDFSGSE